VDDKGNQYIFESGAIDTTENRYIRVYLPKSSLAEVRWIESRCNGYKFIMSPKNNIPYAVFLTEQDYIMFTLKWE
jgi:hypothetical protein